VRDRFPPSSQPSSVSSRRLYASAACNSWLLLVFFGVHCSLMSLQAWVAAGAAPQRPPQSLPGAAAGGLLLLVSRA
jgi:hypothetical protein